jgi:uncharacterized membrane-anchored protein
MTPKELVKLNNEKRGLLNEENLAYYQEMLVFIRTNATKSEQQTEEVLLELLEHLLQAQSEGRSAMDVFGTDPKEYCQSVIDEIPDEKKSKQLGFIVYIALQFLAPIALTFGVIGFILSYFFDLGSSTVSFSLGSWAVIIMLYLAIGFFSILFIFKLLKNDAFKKKKRQRKWLNFLQLWILYSVFIGLFILIPVIMPEFGMRMSIHILFVALIGVALYVVAFLLNKKWKIMK